MHFQVSSLLLIMCMLFTIKVIGILIKSYLALDRALCHLCVCVRACVCLFVVGPT